MSLLRSLKRRLDRLEAYKPPPPEKKARMPLLEWTKRYLSATQDLPPSSFHRWLCTTLDGMQPGGKFNVLSPRGAGKSTLVSLAFPLREALEGREPFIVLVSDTAEQAKDFLEQIRREIETNEELQAAYPESCRKGKRWRSNRISLANGCEIAALGTRGKIRGRKTAGNIRPSLLLIDDPQNKDHIQSALQRRRSLEWLTKDALSAGTPKTRVVVVGTALHREAIVCDLERRPGWSSRKWQMIQKWPDRLDLWQEYEDRLFDYSREEQDRVAVAVEFYKKNRREMDKGAELLWPEHLDLLTAMTKRASDGHAAFESEMQNNPIDPAACEWPEDYLNHPSMYFDEWPEKLAIKTVSLDPSKGASDKQGDYSAIVKFGRDRFGIEYLEADLARRPIDVMCHDLARHCKEFAPHGVGVETTAFQSLLVVPIRAAASKLGVDLPIYKMEHAGVPKIVRIRQLTQPLAQRRWRFKTRSPGTQLLIQQLRDVPFGEHDDGPDAAAAARDLAIQLTTPGHPVTHKRG